MLVLPVRCSGKDAGWREKGGNIVTTMDANENCSKADLPVMVVEQLL